MTGADLIAIQAEADDLAKKLRDRGDVDDMHLVYRLRMAVFDYDRRLRTIRLALELPPGE
jgi:hypothetical protein